MQTLFIPVEYNKPLGSKFLVSLLAKLGDNKRVGLFTTVQFLKQFEQLESFLKENGKDINVGESDYRALKRGQVLGCDPKAALVNEANVDCYVYLGSGVFHPLGVALKTEKPVFIANPLSGEVEQMSPELIRSYKIRIKDMLREFWKKQKIGILVCTKPGQSDPIAAEEARKMLESKGKQVYMFLFETIVPEELLNFNDVEAWVNTACHRITTDDAERVGRPIVEIEDIGIKRRH